MKIKSSLKSIKERDLNSKHVKKARVYIINKITLNLKQDKNNFMDNQKP